MRLVKLVPKCPKCSLFTMISKSLVVLSLLCLSVSGLASFKKCCPPGEVFSGMSQVNCVPVPPSSRELYIVNSSKENVTYGEFPMCKNRQDFTTVPLYEVNPDDFLQELACIDIWYRQGTNESVPIFVYCKSNKDRENLHVYEQEAELVPKVLDLRRCCKNNMVFDVSTGRCKPIVNVLNDQFMSLLPEELPLNFLNIQKGIPSCPEAIFTYEIDAENITYDNGNLKVELPGLRKNAVESFIVTDWNTCLELTPDSYLTRRLVVRVCRDIAFCREHGCIQKCCTEEEENYDLLCRKLHAPHMNFYEKISNITGGPSNATEHGILVGLKCKNEMYRLPSDYIHRITQEGYLHEEPHIEPVAYNNYCLDMFKAKRFEGLNAFICFGDKQTEEPVQFTRTMTSSILVGFSCFFLLLTLIVYACLPMLQNVHGKTLMCYSASLLVGYTGLAIIPWVTPDKKLDDDTYETAFCAMLGYIMLFSFLSACSWLNVMCFDIWRTFGRLQGRNSGRSHGRRFLLYNIYAWGVSWSIALFGLLSDQLYILPKDMRPNFGLESCWFDGWYGQLIFFRGPAAIQLTANVVFFILTSKECSKVKAEISRVADPLDPRSKRFHANKTKFIMNVKLFIVMGISWVAEIISAFVMQYTNFEYQAELFYATDVVNCLQGVMIFFLFVAKRRVYQALMKRFYFDLKRKSGCSQASLMLHDPFRVRKSASTGTLTASFAVSGGP